MPKILISDKLDAEGKKVLELNGIECDENTSLTPEELKSAIASYDGIIVRSRTKLPADVIEAALSMKVIGRAGTGVDNVDLVAATKKGILVLNAPESNTHSTAELAFSMLLALSRNIPQACASVKAGQWQKQRFAGVEITEKTIGILGFGRIGSHMAQFARAFDMEILVNDPYVTEDSVARFGAKTVDLDQLLERADFITVHTPLTPETKGMLNSKAFAKMKPGVRIINCARGGIIDEQALADAIEKGIVAGAAMDVFEAEPPQNSPLVDLEKVIATPHLGASTAEAQKNVAVEIAERIVAYFKTGQMNGAVNLPSVDQKVMQELEPYMTLCEKLGAFSSQMMSGQIKDIVFDYSGGVGNYNVTPLTRSALKGFLGHISEEPVNIVNATVKAAQHGIKYTEIKSSDVTDFADLIKLTVKTDREEFSIVGTIFGARNDPRIVRINNFHVDAIPSGTLIIIHNWDRAGAIGRIGTVLGKHGTNIADMTLGRNIELDKAVILINIDGNIDANALEDIKNINEIISVKVVYL
jgi:D-3-phosphoglycerate dehydrogenase / 2-oxoglutarate reductase